MCLFQLGALLSRQLAYRALILITLLSAFAAWSPVARSAVIVVVAIEVYKKPPAAAPAVVTGQSYTGFLRITNINVGADTGFPNTISVIALTSACEHSNGLCTGFYQPSVFPLLSEGVGSDGSCLNQKFTISLLDPATGTWMFTPSGGSLAVPQGATCEIAFTFRAMNVSKYVHTDVYEPVTRMAATVQVSGQGTFSGGTGDIFTWPGCVADFDGNGSIDPLTDGLLLLRSMFGLTGTAVTSGAVAGNATRKTWTDIRAYMNGFCGTSFGP